MQGDVDAGRYEVGGTAGGFGRTLWGSFFRLIALASEDTLLSKGSQVRSKMLRCYDLNEIHDIVMSSLPSACGCAI